MAERGLSTTSTHSQQAPEIPLGHEPSPTRGIDGATADRRVVTPATPSSPFEANVAAVNRADQACSATVVSQRSVALSCGLLVSTRCLIIPPKGTTLALRQPPGTGTWWTWCGCFCLYPSLSCC